MGTEVSVPHAPRFGDLSAACHATSIAPEAWRDTAGIVGRAAAPLEPLHAAFALRCRREAGLRPERKTPMDHHLMQAAQGLNAGQRSALYALATRPPEQLTRDLTRGLAVLAALLLGLGLIFWIAANWQLQTRGFKLGLVQVAMAASVLVALVVPRARTAALLAATLALGGLLALVGQIYQTGADAWQLFAVWAALALVWVAVQRSAVLWSLWVAIAGAAIWLWAGRGGMDAFWHLQALDEVVVGVLAWLPLLGLVAGVALRGWMQGDARWPVGLAAALALSFWTTQSWMRLFASVAGREGQVLLVLALALVLIAVVGVSAMRARAFAVLALVAVAVNAVVLAAAGRWLMEVRVLQNEAGLGLFTLVCLAALGVTATQLLRVQRSWRQEAA